MASVPVSASAASLPRDLDVTPLRSHVLLHTPAGLTAPIRYFPLPVLVHVTEAAGKITPRRAELVAATADMLRYRVTSHDGNPPQLPIALEQLLKPLNTPWVPPLPPGQPHPPQPPETEYVTHRGYLESIAFWMNSRQLIGVNGRALPTVKNDPFGRLKSFYEHKEAVGELLFGVATPMPEAATAAYAPVPASISSAVPAATSVAPRGVPTPAAPAATLPSAAFLVPPPPAGHVRASLPPQGVPTIQAEIEAAEGGAAAAVAKAEGDDTVKMEDTDGSAAAVSASSSTSANQFVIPPAGIPVCATRFDGKDEFALVGTLRSVLPLTLSSAMPADRHPAQTLSVLQHSLPSGRGQQTIAEYWRDRGFEYANDDTQTRIVAVQLEEGPPFIFPADKVWRQTQQQRNEGTAAAVASAASSADVSPPIGALSHPDDNSSLFFPAPTPPAAPTYTPLSALWVSVAADPWHLPSWQRLLDAVTSTRDLIPVRQAYAAFLKVFPTSAAHWKALVEFELAHGEFAEVERIFGAVLMKLPEIELWKMYLVYVKVKHAPPSDMDVAGAEYARALHAQTVAIENAYEFVIKHMGLDIHSGQIWKSYINFVRNAGTNTSANTNAASTAQSHSRTEEAKTTSLRRIFHLALLVPMHPKELDSLWSEYHEFEQRLGVAFANKKFTNTVIAEQQAKYQATLAVSRERRKKFQGIQSCSVGTAYGTKNAVTISNVHVSNRPSNNALQQTLDAQQMQHWLRYIRFEQHQSPHMLKQDSATFRARVILAWRQCLMYLGHYPNLWVDFVKFLQDTHSAAEEVRQAWRDFGEAMPYSIMPTLMRAEAEEEARHMQEAKVAYESLLVCKEKGAPLDESMSFRLPDFVVAEIKAHKARMEGEAAATAANTAAVATAAAPGDAASVKPEVPAVSASFPNVVDDSLVDIYGGDMHRLHPLVFILVMRFLRRCEGTDQARKVFLGVRRHPSITYHTFLYAAYAEHHIYQDLVKAQAIYSVGMKLYGENDAYLRRYLAFLHETNDQQNLRLNFGRLLLTESAESIELNAHLTKTEKLQMRKAQAAATTAAKDGAAAAAAAAASAPGAAQHREAEDDPSIAPDDWWAHINSLLPSSARASSSGGGSRERSAWRERAMERGEGHGTGGSGGTSHATLPSATMLSLWSQYVTFERDTANELSVILKAEAKRDEKLAIRYAHRVVQWIDRWRFLDLWPCSRALRQTLDRMIRLDQAALNEAVRTELANEAERLAMAQGVPAAAAAAAAADASALSLRRRGVLSSDPAVVSALKGGMVRPDTSRLNSFAHGGAEAERVALRSRYGAVAPPEQILNVLSVLPPAHLFTGPFVHPQLIIDMLEQIPDADAAPAPAAQGATGAGTGAGAGGSRKGKRKQQREEEEEEEAAAAAAADVNTPANDLYRQRQQQKMAKLQE